MNWVDIVLIVLIILFAGLGFWRGLVFSLLSFFSTFVNIMLAIFLTRPLNTLMNNWFHLDGALTGAFSNKIATMGEGFSTNLVGMTDSEISSHISSTLKGSNFPFKNMFSNMMNVTNEKIAGKTSITMNEILSKSLGSFFSIIISFVISFLLILLVLWLISLISKKANQIDGIRITDRILGLVFGLVKGAICIAFIFAILSFFKEDGILRGLFEQINQSAIGSWAYKNVNYLVDKYLNFRTLANAIKR